MCFQVRTISKCVLWLMSQYSINIEFALNLSFLIHVNETSKCLPIIAMRIKWKSVWSYVTQWPAHEACQEWWMPVDVFDSLCWSRSCNLICLAGCIQRDKLSHRLSVICSFSKCKYGGRTEPFVLLDFMTVSAREVIKLSLDNGKNAWETDYRIELV